MIKEIAITPFVFDEDFNAGLRNWLSCMRKLASSMFPERYPCPYVVSNLHGGNWGAVTVNKIQEIRDHRAKTTVQQFYSKLCDVLVDRPSTRNFDWPGGDDKFWADEALRLSQAKGESIDRIVVCNDTAEAIRTDGGFVWKLTEVEVDRFWEGMQPNDSVPMSIGEQMQRLRLLCLHTGVMAFYSKHIRGAADDETAFAKALIRCAGARPGSYGDVTIDIHTEYPKDQNGYFSEEQARTRISNVKQSLSGLSSSKLTVRLFFWKWTVGILNRIFLAGEMRTRSGESVPKFKWGISMDHVARRSDDTSQVCEWKLLKQDRVGNWARRFYQGNSQPELGPLVIQ